LRNPIEELLADPGKVYKVFNLYILMDSEPTRYKNGDIITHKTFPTLKRKIIHIYKGENNHPEYTTLIEDSDYPPSIMTESAIDEFYVIEPKDE
jgi:hypothetical protein